MISRPASDGDQCLAPGCERSPAHRGLCIPCYNRARSAVAQGTVTWERLESIGLAKSCPKQQENPFTVALREALKQPMEATP